MQIVLFIILSFFLSLGIETINELSIFKEIANLGYKVDLSIVEQYVDKKDNFKWLVMSFIPGLNVFASIKRLKKYDSFRNDISNKVNEMDLFIKMDDEEYQSYLDNPKAINAFNISFDYNTDENKNDYMKPKGFIRISKGIFRQDNNDGTFNEISFRKESEYIVVTDIKGEISKLDKDKQIDELNKIFNTLYNKFVVIEEKSDITLEKELLIEHRNDILNSINEKQLRLK